MAAVEVGPGRPFHLRPVRETPPRGQDGAGPVRRAAGRGGGWWGRVTPRRVQSRWITKEARLMKACVNPARCYPECGSREYVCRGRKNIPANLDQPPAVETKYACKACGHAWK